MGSSKEARVDESDLRETSSDEVKFDGSLKSVHGYGGNGSKPSYQEVSGAPAENISPLGLQVTWFTTIFLNIGQMIGTGVFSTRKPFSCIQHNSFVLMYLALGTMALNSCHNPQRGRLRGSLPPILDTRPCNRWLATCGLRRASKKAISPIAQKQRLYTSSRPTLGLNICFRPPLRFNLSFFPSVHPMLSVLTPYFSLKLCNTDILVVIAQYLYDTGGHTPTAWQLKGLAVGCMTFIILCKPSLSNYYMSDY